MFMVGPYTESEHPLFGILAPAPSAARTLAEARKPAPMKAPISRINERLPVAAMPTTCGQSVAAPSHESRTPCRPSLW